MCTWKEFKRFIKRTVHQPFSYGPSIFHLIKFFQVRIRTTLDLLCFLSEFLRYRKMSHEEVRLINLYPFVWERTATSSIIADMYTYQDTWAARKIVDKRPKRHVDVASSKFFLVMLSVFVDVIAIDIRPVVTKLPGIEPHKGDVCHLAFADNSLDSISSLSVIEHVGLGRYGDALDPQGTTKAASELLRVLRPGGDLYVAVPIGVRSEVHFNAHRIHTCEDFLALFPQCKLLDETYALSDRYLGKDEYDAVGRPYAYGCYHFTKQ